MASSSKEQELAIKIAGKVENSFKQSLGVTEDGLNKIASVAKKAAAVAAAAFAARLRRNGEGTIHLPYSMCDTRGHNRHKERASPRPQPAYKSYSVSPSAISVAAHELPRFPDSPYRSMQI